MPVPVQLPRGHTPIFPARCVGCGVEEPGHTVTLWDWNVSWWVILTVLAALWSKTARASAPACGPCAWRLRLRRLAFVAYFAAIAAFLIYGLNHWLQDIPRLPRKLIGVAGAAVLLFPAAYFSACHPPSFSLDVDGDQVTYSFRDWETASAFAELNGTQAGLR